MSTPGLARALAAPTPGTVTPEHVVAAALRALGRKSRVIPGLLMKLSSGVMSRLRPRRAAIAVMAPASRDLLPP